MCVIDKSELVTSDYQGYCDYRSMYVDNKQNITTTPQNNHSSSKPLLSGASHPSPSPVNLQEASSSQIVKLEQVAVPLQTFDNGNQQNPIVIESDSDEEDLPPVLVADKMNEHPRAPKEIPKEWSPGSRDRYLSMCAQARREVAATRVDNKDVVMTNRSDAEREDSFMSLDDSQGDPQGK